MDAIAVNPTHSLQVRRRLVLEHRTEERAIATRVKFYGDAGRKLSKHLHAPVHPISVELTELGVIWPWSRLLPKLTSGDEEEDTHTLCKRLQLTPGQYFELLEMMSVHPNNRVEVGTNRLNALVGIPDDPALYIAGLAMAWDAEELQIECQSVHTRSFSAHSLFAVPFAVFHTRSS